ELDERTAWALSMQEDLARLHASTAWRVVAPARRLLARAQAARAGLRFRLSRAVNLARRVRLSLATRGLAGTFRRWRGQKPALAGPASQWITPTPTSTVPPASLPSSPAPLVSIVIPIHGKLAYTC